MANDASPIPASQRCGRNDAERVLTSPFKAIRDGAFDIALREYKRIALKTLLTLSFTSPFIDTRKKRRWIL